MLTVLLTFWAQRVSGGYAVGRKSADAHTSWQSMAPQGALGLRGIRSCRQSCLARNPYRLAALRGPRGRPWDGAAIGFLARNSAFAAGSSPVDSCGFRRRGVFGGTPRDADPRAISAA